MIKRLILSILAAFAFAIASTGLGADTSLFSAKELSVSLGTGYVVDYRAKSVANAFADKYDLNFNAGVQYYATKHFGVEVNVPFYQNRGVSVSEVKVGGLARVTVFNHLSPYVGLGGGYDWQQPNNWTYIGKAGLEWRFNPKWGVYTEAQYRNGDLKFTGGATSIAAGIRLVF